MKIYVKSEQSTDPKPYQNVKINNQNPKTEILINFPFELVCP